MGRSGSATSLSLAMRLPRGWGGEPGRCAQAVKGPAASRSPAPPGPAWPCSAPEGPSPGAPAERPFALELPVDPEAPEDPKRFKGRTGCDNDQTFVVNCAHFTAPLTCARQRAGRSRPRSCACLQSLLFRSLVLAVRRAVGPSAGRAATAEGLAVNYTAACKPARARERRKKGDSAKIILLAK